MTNLRIVLGNSNIAVVGLDLNFWIIGAAHQNIDMMGRFLATLLLLFKVIDNLPSHGVGHEMKSSFLLQGGESVAILHRRMNGKIVFFPPIVNQTDVSGFDTKIEAAEAIVSEQPAASELGMRFRATHFFNQDFALR